MEEIDVFEAIRKHREKCESEEYRGISFNIITMSIGVEEGDWDYEDMLKPPYSPNDCDVVYCLKCNEIVYAKKKEFIGKKLNEVLNQILEEYVISML